MRTCQAIDPYTRKPCGNEIPALARWDKKTCSPTCRKRLSRAQPENQRRARLKSLRNSLANAERQLGHYTERVAEVKAELAELMKEE